MFALGALEIVSMVVGLAGFVILLWLAITVIRAMNVYIPKNRVSSLRDETNHGARL